MKNHYNLIFKIKYFIVLTISVGLFSCGDSKEVKEQKYSELLVEIETALKENRNERALELTDLAKDIIEDRTDILVYKSLAYSRLKEFKESEKYADKAIKIDGDSSAGYKVKALNAYANHKNEKAIEYANKYIEYHQKDYDIVKLLANSFYKINKYEEAIVYLTMLVESENITEEVILKRGKAYLALGNLDKSIEDLLFLSVLEPRSREKNQVDFLLADIYIKQSKPREALGYLKEIDTIIKNKYLGITYEYLNKRDSALYYYNDYLVNVDLNDLFVLKKIYNLSIDKTLDDTELLEMKNNIYRVTFKQEKERIFLWGVGLLGLLFFIIIKILVNKTKRKELMFDSYTVLIARLKAKQLFLFCGSWFYLNKSLMGIMNAILCFIVIVTISKLVMMYNLQLILYVYSWEFYVLIISLLIIIILKVYEQRSIPGIVKKMNILFRKNIDPTLIRERREQVKLDAKKIDDSKQVLDSIFNL